MLQLLLLHSSRYCNFVTIAAIILILSTNVTIVITILLTVFDIDIGFVIPIDLALS